MKTHTRRQKLDYMAIIEQGVFIYKDEALCWLDGTPVEIARSNRDPYSYSSVTILGASYKVAELVWTYFNGSVPVGFVLDHRSRIRSDNRIGNLRLATYQQNAWNKAIKGSHSKGVRKYSKNSWFAEIVVCGCKTRLGLFKTEVEAAEAYRQASLKAHGEFSIFKEVL